MASIEDYSPPSLKRQAASRSPLAAVSVAFYFLNRAYAFWSLGVNTVLYGFLYTFARGIPPAKHTRPRPKEGYAPTVFVTGAHDGVGRSVAFLLAESGYTVYAGVRRSQDLQDLRLAFDSYSSESSTPVIGSLRAIACDVLDREQISSVAVEISKAIAGDRSRPFVGVVNVAGFCMVSPLELTARADVTRMIDLDLMAYLDVIRAFFPLLRGNRGRVVNIGSVGGYAAVPGWTVYSGVKAAVENLTRAWAMETVQLGIRMTTVRPGIVASGAIGPKIQHAIDGRRRDEKAVGYDSLGDVLLPEEGANPAGKAAYQPLMERNAQNLELAKVGGTPAINVAKTVRDALTELWMQPVYTVGEDALFAQMIRDFVPDPIYEWMVIKGMV